MAINQTVVKRNLLVNVENGVNDDGTIKTKAVAFSGIKNDAPMANIFAAGTALAGLMAKNPQGIGLSEKSELIQQG
ncbi:MAG: DUF1659 domain-containing protein [Acidaminococcaceae bacterium]|nr:DUF1659 domain-containing protein [Acidaminococcaceae bacterium]